MQDTGTGTGTGSYQQPSTRTGGSTSYGRETAPARSPGYGASGGYGRPTANRGGGALAMLAGAVAFLQGLAFVIRSGFYHSVPGYAYRWHLHGWGWTLLILGALLFGAGVTHLLGIKAGRQAAAVLAVLTAVVAFLTLIYSVVWGIIVVALSAAAAHSLLTHHDTGTGRPADAEAMGYGGRGESYEGVSQERRAGHRI